MARRKKLIILSGMQTKYLSTLASWLESVEIKKPETDDYGENPRLREILDAILRSNGSWVFDAVTDTTKVEISEQHIEDIKELLSAEYAKKTNTGVYKDVLFIKDGRTALILNQLAKALKNIDILVYVVTAQGEVNEFLQGFDFESPKALLKAYGKCLIQAEQEGVCIKSYGFKELPEDFSSHPADLFKYLKKKRLIKEIPEFENLEVKSPPLPPEPPSWDDGDDEELAEAMAEGK